MSPTDITTFSKHKNLPHFFCQKEEDLQPVFQKMLEGLSNSTPGHKTIAACMNDSSQVFNHANTVQLSSFQL